VAPVAGRMPVGETASMVATAAPESRVGLGGAPADASSLTGGAVAVQAPPQEDPVPEPVAPEFADTAQLDSIPPSVETSNLPLAAVQPPGPRPANGEIYSKTATSFFSRFEGRTLTLVGGALAVVFVFALTYLGATLVFRPSNDAVAAGGKRVSPREAFVAEVDEMCSRASRSATGLPPPGDTAAMADFTSNAISTQRKLVSEMRGLMAPAKNKALFRAIIKESKVQLGHMRDLVDAAAVGDQAGTNAALERMAGSEKRIDRMSVNYGLKECT
jgi:hypothetical protein